MKSFNQFIKESPIAFDAGEPDEYLVGNERPFLGRSVSGIPVRLDNNVMRVLKPKKIGTIPGKTSLDEYGVFHHASVKENKHHIFVATGDGKIVGSIQGERIGSEKKSGTDHIVINIAAFDPEHRGHGLYAKAIQAYVDKFPHVVYSDEAQTAAAGKSWNRMAQEADERGHDVRVHPDMGATPTTGVSWNKPLDDRFWTGVPTESGRTIQPEKIRFSIRGNPKK